MCCCFAELRKTLEQDLENLDKTLKETEATLTVRSMFPVPPSLTNTFTQYRYYYLLYVLYRLSIREEHCCSVDLTLSLSTTFSLSLTPTTGENPGPHVGERGAEREAASGGGEEENSGRE